MKIGARRGGRFRDFIFFSLILTSATFSSPHPDLLAGHEENVDHLSNGFFRILTAAFQIPRYLLQKTLNEPIGLGTIDGALQGAYYAVAEVSGGALEMVRGAAPYAKYLIFFA